MVQFTYPADVAAAALVDRAARWQVYKIAAAKAAASAASALLAAENANPFIDDRNYSYVAQGDNP